MGKICFEYLDFRHSENPIVSAAFQKLHAEYFASVLPKKKWIMDLDR